jgi:hypothetical protein
MVCWSLCIYMVNSFSRQLCQVETGNVTQSIETFIHFYSFRSQSLNVLLSVHCVLQTNIEYIYFQFVASFFH